MSDEQKAIKRQEDELADWRATFPDKNAQEVALLLSDAQLPTVEHIQDIYELAKLRAENDVLRRDRERLLNVLEHAALHPLSQPTNHYQVCGSVVKELRAAR